jgi:hypothetical protein
MSYQFEKLKDYISGAFKSGQTRANLDKMVQVEKRTLGALITEFFMLTGQSRHRSNYKRLEEEIKKIIDYEEAKYSPGKSDGIGGQIKDKMYRYPPREMHGHGFFSNLINIGKSLLGSLFSVGKTILSKPENISKVYNATKQVYNTTKDAIDTFKSKQPITEKVKNIIPNLIETGKQVISTSQDIVKQNQEGGSLIFSTPRNQGKLLHSIKGTGHGKVNYYKLRV